MIHTNELMLGNWVELGGGHIVEITGINNVSVSYSYKTNKSRVNTPEQYAVVTKNSIHPIPITEELLEKCGFRKGKYYWFGPNEIEVDLEKSAVLMDFVGDEDWRVTNIQFLHELQNAYFMLTKKHLEVKL